MTIPEILKELELHRGRFPLEAMQAAIEQQEAITPELLHVLEMVAGDPAAWARRTDCMLHEYALFLLAQFREKRAYPLMEKLFSAPEDTLYDLFGDTVTESLGQILGSVYNGDPTLLERLIEDKKVDEFVRNSAIEAFLVLEHTGQMPRAQVVGYFKSLFDGRLPHDGSYAWCGLVDAVVNMPAPELVEDVRLAFSRGLIDPCYIELENFEEDLLEYNLADSDKYCVITDAIGEMEWWASFHPEDEEPDGFQDQEARLRAVPHPVLPSMEHNFRPREPIDEEPQYDLSVPFVREPKIGRNEPCPCGSGLKYKKCCGQ